MYKNRRLKAGGSGLILSQHVKQSENDKNQQNAKEPVPSSSRGLIGAAPAAMTQRPPPVSKEKPPILDEDQEDFLMSQFSIPASQEPMQRRYVSQRSQAMRSQAIVKKVKHVPSSYFESVLTKCGVTLDDEQCYVLNHDHIIFMNKLRDTLSSHPDYPENVQEFLTGLQDSIKQPDNFVKLMGSCMVVNHNSDITSYSQDSLLKIFLGLDFLLEDLLEIMMVKMKVLAMNDVVNLQDPPLFPLMLSHLKFVDHATSENLLFQKITEMLNQGTENVRAEILGCIEDVIGPKKHDSVVRNLMNIYPRNADLFTVRTVNTFDNMSLSRGLKGELRTRIIHFMKQGCELELLPVFVNFILDSANDEEPEITIKILTNIRHCLRWNIGSNRQSEVNESQTNVFNYISQSMIYSDKLFESWFKSIQSVANVEDHTPVDILILLLLISINEDKTISVESLIRKKIRSEIFVPSILERTVQEFSAITCLYSKILLEMLDTFFRDRDLHVFRYGKIGFRLMFSSANENQRQCLSKLVGFVCDKNTMSRERVTQAGNLRTPALELLREINQINPEDTQKNGLQILRVLDQKSDLTLVEYRLLMSILTSMAYPLPPLQPCDLLLDHVNILVKKQVSSGILSIKKQGIVGLIRVIDRIVWDRSDGNQSDTSFDSEITFSTMNDLPDGLGKETAVSINLMLTSTSTCIESLSLCYDELATVFSPKNSTGTMLDKYFMTWFCDLMTSDFQKYFVIEEVPMDCGVDLSFDYCINTEIVDACADSEIMPIAINIAGLVLQPSLRSSSSIEVMCPLFSLLRVLHFRRYNGNLESINALLGCAIVLPKLKNADGSSIDIFDEYEAALGKKILDIYFITANWFRETISAFVTQTDANILVKVLKRLAALIDLEDTIRQQLKRAPASYVVPKCQFMIPAQTNISKMKRKNESSVHPVSRRQSKKTKPNDTAPLENADISLMDTMRSMNTTTGNLAMPNRKKASPEKKQCFNTTYGDREVYRQMDPDIMLLLKLPFELTYPLPADKVGHVLGLLDLRFIMEDLIIKLESLTGVQKFVAEQQIQYILSPNDLVNDIIIFLPKIMTFFKQLSKCIASGQANLNGNYADASLHTDSMNHIKTCYALCVRLLATVMTWPELKQSENEKLLKAGLRIVAYQSIVSTQDQEIEHIAKTALRNALTFKKTVLDLKAAVHLFHLTKVLAKFSGNKESEEVVNLCKEFLSRSWYNYEGCLDQSGQANVLLEELLKGIFAHTNLVAIADIARWIVTEVVHLKNKTDHFITFPGFNKLNFPLLYRSLATAFTTKLKYELDHSDSEWQSQLKVWEQACDVLNILLAIIKAIAIPRNFTIFLKHAHVFLKLFVQHGIGKIEICLRKNPTPVNDLLKSLQQTTRFLHNLCCHSKAIKNTSIIAQIPFLRGTIENLVFRVKAMLAANNCSSVFWMGNLKNKDIHGDEILSQSSYDDVRDNGNDHDDDNDDDDDDDDESGPSENEDNAAVDDNESLDETIVDKDYSNARSSRRSSRTQSKCF